ncbi:diversity-generating retroelement protein Avd [Candidatus Woesebacteria bacterium]|nr:diversity-generating retroelement protein Avd [Candidatus Woesebacteria bacterium]
MLETFDLPIFNKIYDFYKEIYKLRGILPRQGRYTLWQKVEVTTLGVIENILLATTSKTKKIEALEEASNKLNVLRFFIRLSKDVKILDTKKYISLQEKLDEIGRMLGGWIKSTKTP